MLLGNSIQVTSVSGFHWPAFVLSGFPLMQDEPRSGLHAFLQVVVSALTCLFHILFHAVLPVPEAQASHFPEMSRYYAKEGRAEAHAK